MNDRDMLGPMEWFEDAVERYDADVGQQHRQVVKVPQGPPPVSAGLARLVFLVDTVVFGCVIGAVAYKLLAVIL